MLVGATVVVRNTMQVQVITLRHFRARIVEDYTIYNYLFYISKTELLAKFLSGQFIYAKERQRCMCVCVCV